MISNIHRNVLGTVSFDGQFQGMRKPQEFVVYPVGPGPAPVSITVQSDSRIGQISLLTGSVTMSAPRPGGIGFAGLRGAIVAGTLTGEQMLMLKAALESTATKRAGTNGVVTVDNSGMRGVLG